MKRAAARIGIVMFGATLICVLGGSRALPSGPEAASGHGTITFGEHGVGLFSFDVSRVGGVGGSLLFAGEHQHRYPDIVIRMDSVHRVGFRPHSVTFQGDGKLHETDVSIIISATDGEGTSDPDTLSIECTDANGVIVFEAAGEVVIGDIQVGEPS